MSNRRPNPRQVALLTAVAARQAYVHDGATGRRTYRVDLGFGMAPATPDVTKLVERGWVDPGRVKATGQGIPLALTSEGQEALRDAVDRAEYDAIPWDQRPRVRVEPRPLGRSPIRGMRGPAPGRNVRCWHCYRVQRDSGSGNPDPVVWFTNESGHEARVRADRQMIRHALAHVRGEIPTPKED